MSERETFVNVMIRLLYWFDVRALQKKSLTVILNFADLQEGVEFERAISQDEHMRTIFNYVPAPVDAIAWDFEIGGIRFRVEQPKRFRP